MDRTSRFRINVLLICAVCIIVFYGIRLFKLQMIDAVDNGSGGENTYTYYSTVTAARGSILDANGNILVSNRASYNLSLNYFVLFNAEDPNGSLQALAERFSALDLSVTDHLPVSFTRPYTYQTQDLSSSYQTYFTQWLEKRKLSDEQSAEQLIRTLRTQYHLPDDLPDELLRTLVGMRYELDLRRYFGNLEDYIVTYDVQTDQLASLLELSTPGLSVLTSTQRVYETTYCAHILGRVGLMDSDEYAYYKDYGYPMNALVGKDGLERAFENYLHGVDGVMKTTVTATGEIIEQEIVTEPQPGKNVMLTIDLDLQAAAEDALATVIEDLQENGVGTYHEGRDTKGGAVVVQEIKTGAVLACGSYPTYQLSTFSKDFATLSQDPDAPLFDRALLAPQPPGSVFKMVTAITAIDCGAIDRYHTIYDEGIYNYYPDTPLRCYYYKNTGMTHGSLNVMQALSVSCNYYFYELGRMLGIEPIDAVAKALGLGEHTGVELYEEIGTRANPETKAAQHAGTENESWYGADSLVAAIGQSEHRYTPMQLCSYVSTLANGGTRYRATFLKKVSSSDYSETVFRTEPEVLSTLTISEDALAAVREGMVMTAQSGTACDYLADYPISVACKTGTAEHGSGGSDHASFVLYAPAENPEIAISVYVENGAQGGYLSNVAKAVLDLYFSRETGATQDAVENQIG